MLITLILLFFWTIFASNIIIKEQEKEVSICSLPLEILSNIAIYCEDDDLLALHSAISTHHQPPLLSITQSISRISKSIEKLLLNYQVEPFGNHGKAIKVFVTMLVTNIEKNADGLELVHELLWNLMPRVRAENKRFLVHLLSKYNYFNDLLSGLAELHICTKYDVSIAAASSDNLDLFKLVEPDTMSVPYIQEKVSDLVWNNDSVNMALYLANMYSSFEFNMNEAIKRGNCGRILNSLLSGKDTITVEESIKLALKIGNHNLLHFVDKILERASGEMSLLQQADIIIATIDRWKAVGKYDFSNAKLLDRLNLEDSQVHDQVIQSILQRRRVLEAICINLDKVNHTLFTPSFLFNILRKYIEKDQYMTTRQCDLLRVAENYLSTEQLVDLAVEALEKQNYRYLNYCLEEDNILKWRSGIIVTYLITHNQLNNVNTIYKVEPELWPSIFDAFTVEIKSDNVNYESLSDAVVLLLTTQPEDSNKDDEIWQLIHEYIPKQYISLIEKKLWQAEHQHL